MPTSTDGTRVSTYRTLEALVYEELRAAITEGRYVPGQRLIALRLAQDLGVSRAPVTVALKRLQSEGFVRSDPHKVITVTQLQVSQVREIYAMRSALEALAAREAAALADPEQIRQLRLLAEQIREHVEDSSRRYVLDYQFHRQLRETSGMPLLTATLQNLYDQCEYHRTLVRQARRLPDLLRAADEHFLIVAALEARAHERAASLIAAHIDASAAPLLAHLESGPIQPVGSTTAAGDADSDDPAAASGR